MDKIILFSIIPICLSVLSFLLMAKFISWRKEENDINHFIVKQNAKLTILESILVILFSILDIFLNSLVFFQEGNHMFIQATLANLFVIFFILMFLGCINIKILIDQNELVYISFFRKKSIYGFSDIIKVEKAVINGNITLRIYLPNRKIIVSKIYNNLDLLENKLKQRHILIEEMW